MKYNLCGVNCVVMLFGFFNWYLFVLVSYSQGYLVCLYELQNFFKEVIGMKGVLLVFMVGVQGEFVGVVMICVYYEVCGDDVCIEILIFEVVYGINLVIVVMCGYKVCEVFVGKDGDVDLEVFKEVCGL